MLLSVSFSIVNCMFELILLIDDKTLLMYLFHVGDYEAVFRVSNPQEGTDCRTDYIFLQIVHKKVCKSPKIW